MYPPSRGKKIPCRSKGIWNTAGIINHCQLSAGEKCKSNEKNYFVVNFKAAKGKKSILKDFWNLQFVLTFSPGGFQLFPLHFFSLLSSLCSYVPIQTLFTFSVTALWRFFFPFPNCLRHRCLSLFALSPVIWWPNAWLGCPYANPPMYA